MSTGLIVNGLALPEMLVEIDIDAVIPVPGTTGPPIVPSLGVAANTSPAVLPGFIAA